MFIAAASIMFKSYQSSRIVGWLDPWADPNGKGYNLIQSWYAISSGGLFGVGFGASKQKLLWLPFGYTDFIFAVIAEEFGFLGCLFLLGILIAFIHNGFMVSRRANDVSATLSFWYNF
jgi:cell division protein FtsW